MYLVFPFSSLTHTDCLISFTYDFITSEYMMAQLQSSVKHIGGLKLASSLWKYKKHSAVTGSKV